MSLADLSLRSIKVRLFLTCWMVYVLHFATDFVREHYLVLSIVESHTFRLDPYLGMHVDIFQNPPTAPHGGAHHGANPGISFVGAIPYFLTKPAVDLVVARTLAARGPPTPQRSTTIPWRRVEFWKVKTRVGCALWAGRGVTQALCAPQRLFRGPVFGLLGHLGLGRRMALALSFLYASAAGLLRTGYLNRTSASVSPCSSVRPDLESAGTSAGRFEPDTSWPASWAGSAFSPTTAEGSPWEFWACMRCGSGETRRASARDSATPCGMLRAQSRRY